MTRLARSGLLAAGSLGVVVTAAAAFPTPPPVVDSTRAAALPSPPASAQPRAATPGTSFRLTTKISGLKSPTWIGHAPGDSKGLWVTQQGGQLLRIVGKKKTVKLTIAKRTKADGERGLLSAAFLPGYATNHLVVMSSTNLAGDTRVELWRIGSSAKKAKLVRTLLKQKQPFPNHNGGMVTFGDGDDLYLGLGDGGSADDPQRNGQNLGTKLGKILVAQVTAKSKPSWKIAAYGLRNPWRFWFDPAGKELWIGDVGQDAIEEIDRVKPDPANPPNLGWSVFEGGQRDPKGDDALSGPGTVIWPVATYRHDDTGGCSITGGQLYTGTAIDALKGRYLYGDYCSGNLWTVEPKADGTVGPIRLETAKVPTLATFGADAAGELYAASQSGTVYALDAPR
jgi:glucose/arabinose dehydrogenase